MSICQTDLISTKRRTASMAMGAPFHSYSLPTSETRLLSTFPISSPLHRSSATPFTLRSRWTPVAASSSNIPASAVTAVLEERERTSFAPRKSLPFRVGHGFDLHRLEPGYPLIIGGIDIPHDRGCEAHSDGTNNNKIRFFIN